MNKDVVVFVVMAAFLVAVAAGILTGAVPFYLIVIGIIAIAAFLFFTPTVVEFKEYERGVLFTFGKFKKVAGPGWFVNWPVFESYTLVDLRTSTIDLPTQEVITKDDVDLHVDAIIYQRVVDPKKAVLEIKDYKSAMRELLKSQIRSVIGKMTLEEVIEHTEDINNELKTILKPVAEEWGVATMKVEVQSIELPPSLVEAMTKRRESGEYKIKLETEAQAKQLSLEILDKATSKLDSKTMAYLYIDSLKAIANGRANKIIIPLELSHMADSISEKMYGPRLGNPNAISGILNKLGLVKK